MNFKKWLLLLFPHILLCQFAVAQSKQFKALLVITTRGWHHESIHQSVLAILYLDVNNNFDVVLFENLDCFTDRYRE